MKKKHILISLCVAILIATLSGGIALAGWVGPYWDIEGETIDWRGRESGGDARGWVCQYAEWELYWDTEQQAYTQYELQNDGYGYIDVHPDSYYWIVEENVQVFEYDNSNPWYLYLQWYDVVYPGEFWKEYWPGVDTVLTKPTTGTDVTRTHWWFDWNLYRDSVCACDAMVFNYASEEFEYVWGWE